MTLPDDPSPVGAGAAAPQPEPGGRTEGLAGLKPAAGGHAAGASRKASDEAAAGRTPLPGAGGATTPSIAAEQIRGAANVAGNQFNYHYASSEGAKPPVAAPEWEDELVGVPHLPTPDILMPADEIGASLALLLSRRILLVRHAPSREPEAVSALRAVLQALRGRDPGRQAYCSGLHGAVQLDTLRRARSWRAELQGAVIYMYRDDPATLKFFTSPEDVGALCKRLEEMDCHLALTAAVVTGSVLRDEPELARRVAVWTFDDTEPRPTADLAQEMSAGFDVTLAMLASLFPGLGLKEFIELADRLEPQPPAREPALAAPAVPGAHQTAQPVAPPPPPTRHERWWVGARDHVLQELKIALMQPPQASEEGLAKVDAGMYFETPARQAEVQAWLYRRAPIRLLESLDVLTEHYLSPAASNRYCVAYRRMLRALDTMGIHAVSSDWLARHFRAGLDRPDLALLVARLVELLSEWPGGGQGDRLAESVMGELAAIVSEQERDIAGRLYTASPLDEDMVAGLKPYAASVWSALLGEHDARDSVARAALRQAAALDLLMTLLSWFPAASARALGKALAGSVSAYDGWRQPDLAADELPPVVSLARVVFRDLQLYLLRSSPSHWVALAHALGSEFAPPARQPGRAAERQAAQQSASADGETGRWLLWDCAFSLMSVLDDLSPQLPAAFSAAFLSDECRPRAAQALAAIWRATLPSSWGEAGRPTEVLHVDPDSLLWVYQLLAMAALQPVPADTARASLTLAELLAPLHTWLTRPQRMDLVELCGVALDVEVSRRDELDDRHARNASTRRIQGMQLLLRLLRSAPPASSP